MDPKQPDHAQQLRRALLAIETAEARTAQLEAARREPIAVVGLGGRFPRAATVAELWDNLLAGVDGIREVPADRWDVDALFDPDPDAPGKMITRWGGFIDGLDRFDPAFFGVSPREAARMDPQQRLALEVAWEALEDAAIVPAALAGRAAGVFLGACGSDYATLFGDDLAAIDAHTTTGVAVSIIANRISYLLDLKGPSLAVDTACSSSLVAIHLACQSLRAGECELALAGGVSAIFAPHEAVFFSRARALARDGRCKAFDARADGFVRGEGCGVVVLKRASDARAAGDRILALVRGSAVNQDGTTSGMTAPNGLAQQAVIRRALDSAGVAPGRVGYVETHGTGTALGDPIEVEALAAVLGAPGGAGTCWLGAIKTHIGHLEGGAGVAGFVKAVLALDRGVIPPNLHFRELNPRISVAGTRLGFPTAPVAWPAGAQARFAGVSAFGFGGTNAHVVLEDARAPAVRTADATPAPALVIPLSARSAPALAEVARRLDAHLAAHPAQALVDVCYTAALGRAQLRHRVAIQADTTDALRRALAAFAASEASGAPAPADRAIVGPAIAAPRPRVAFLFTGQGAQYANMGRGLYGWSAVFRAAIDECADKLAPHLAVPLPALLFPAAGGEAAGEAAIDETVHAQPALFALEYALVQLWRSWGVVPDVVMGHSLGELVAACVAGVLGLGDALALVAARGRLVQALPRRGAMAAVRATQAQMIERLAPYGDALVIAAVNGPASLLIAGVEDALAALVERLAADGVPARRLATSHAFHSPLVEPALDAFEACAAGVALSPPRLPIVSNVTGARAGAELATAGYWRRHLRAPVRFGQGLEALRADGATVLLEIGPHATLLGLAAEVLGTGDVALVPSLRRHQDDRAQILAALARVWTHGVAVDWAAVHRAAPGRRVALPTAPFERQRYWYDADPAPAPWRRTAAEARDARPAPGHPLLGRRLPVAGRDDAVFDAVLEVARLPALGDHRVAGQIVVPATGLFEVARAAAAEVLGEDLALVVEDVVLLEPLVVPDAGGVRVQTVVAAAVAGQAGFEIFSAPAGAGAGPWRRHATGVLRRAAAGAAASTDALPRLDRAAVEARCSEAVSVADYHGALAARGLDYGPAFCGITGLRRGAEEAIARISPLAGAPELAGCGVSPALLDLGLQVLGAIAAGGDAQLYLPMAVERIVVRPGAYPALWAHARLRERPVPGAQMLVGDLVLADEAGAGVARIDGLRLRRVDAAALRRADAGARDPGPELYRIDWRPCPRAAAEPVAEQEAPARDRAPHARVERDPAVPSAAVPSRGSAWLILGGDAGLGRALAGALEASGDRTVRARAGEPVQGSVEPALDTARPEHVARLFGEVGAPLRGVVYLGALDGAGDDGGAILERVQRVTASALHVVQAAVRCSPPPALWLITRGAQPAGGGPVDPGQAPLWGLGRTVQGEHPELGCRLLDLDPRVDPRLDPRLASRVDPRLDPAGTGVAREAAAIAGELLHAGVEDQLALRGGVRLAARLVRAEAAPSSRAASDGDNHALVTAVPGILAQLRLAPVERPPPGPGEVEIEVAASGLNFRDVLGALGLYPGDPGPLGGECAGVVRRVGEGVTQLAPGAEVVGLAAGAFRRYVITDARLVVGRPAGLTAEAAATLPITFLTAWYGLHDLAALTRGDRVLIHAAAGGVGLAAIQLAQRAGAEVFATASPGKWPALRERGVEHVMSSRTSAFAGEIMARTGGRGVDVVLNSLSGELLANSFAVLAPAGRFLEIGKRDILDPAGAAALRPDVAYHAFDLAQVSREAPSRIAAMLAEILEGLRAGWLAPLPRQVFPLAGAEAAFRHMAQARHVGKIVLSHGATTGDAPVMGEAQAADPALTAGHAVVAGPARAREPRSVGLRAGAAWLITGGLGGLGLHVARWLVDQGVRELVLFGRSAPGGAAAAAIAAMERAGARVVVVRGDVARHDDVARAVAVAGPPLVGVVHAAGVLDDGVLQQLDADRLARVMAPKVAGAVHLDAVTRALALEAFVMFSSAASLLGSPGQAGYAAANGFLDGLAHRRRAEGLPAISLQWGPWAEVGLAVAAGSAARRAARGLDAIAPAEGVAALGRILRDGGSPEIAALRARWDQVVAQAPAGGEPPLLAEITREVRARAARATHGAGEADRAAALAHQRRGAVLAELAQAAPGRRRTLLVELVRDEVRKTLGFGAAQALDIDQGLGELGFDSLMAVELRNRLQAGLGRALPATLAFDHPTIGGLSELLARDVFGMSAAPAAAPSPPPLAATARDAAAPEAAALDGLSEAAMAALLADTLRDLDDGDGRGGPR